MTLLRHILLTSICVLGAAAFTGCHLVDEDMSECGTDFNLDYELQLVTDITTELSTELSMESDLEISSLLQQDLEGVFVEYASDVDLSFYDTDGSGLRLKHMSEVMNASQTSYTLYLPVREYEHCAVANLKDNGAVTLVGDDNSHTARLEQHAVDGIAPVHGTGLFTARQDIKVLSGMDQHFEVHLHMANASSVLVLDLSEAPNVEEVTVLAEGFATGFNIADSTYVFDGAQRNATREIDTEDALRRSFVAVHFPSRDAPGTKADEVPEDLWRWLVYARMKDGTTTETVLHMQEPRPAGSFDILTGSVRENGVIQPSDYRVGASVTLDWHEGISAPIEF